MKIELLGTRLSLTPSIRTYVDQKIGGVGKFIKRFETEQEHTAFVELARTTRHHRHGEVFYAEVTLRLPGKVIRVEEYHEDIRAAIDRAKDRLKAELSRFKRKVSAKPRGRSLRR
ncbi:MAG: ribosome-associated translation inhibitor RaiA [Candidatus Jorgensenbacteria bacterium]|nr:ribosome-associated translation inhibitor RaiA [Candidatus Jorgensenbacteria bacterium]